MFNMIWSRVKYFFSFDWLKRWANPPHAKSKPTPTSPKKMPKPILSPKEKAFVVEVLNDLDTTIKKLREIRIILMWPEAYDRADPYVQASAKGLLSLSTVEKQIAYHTGNRDAIAGNNFGPMRYYTAHIIPAPNATPQVHSAAVLKVKPQVRFASHLNLGDSSDDSSSESYVDANSTFDYDEVDLSSPRINVIPG